MSKGKYSFLWPHSFYGRSDQITPPKPTLPETLSPGKGFLSSQEPLGKHPEGAIPGLTIAATKNNSYWVKGLPLARLF